MQWGKRKQPNAPEIYVADNPSVDNEDDMHARDSWDNDSFHSTQGSANSLCSSIIPDLTLESLPEEEDGIEIQGQGNVENFFNKLNTGLKKPLAEIQSKTHPSKYKMITNLACCPLCTIQDQRLKAKRQREAARAAGWEDNACLFQKQKERERSVVTMDAEVREILTHRECGNLLAADRFDSKIFSGVLEESEVC